MSLISDLVQSVGDSALEDIMKKTQAHRSGRTVASR